MPIAGRVVPVVAPVVRELRHLYAFTVDGEWVKPTDDPPPTNVGGMDAKFITGGAPPAGAGAGGDTMGVPIIAESFAIEPLFVRFA